MCSYLFVAMAYGMMMQEAGFAWYDSLLASLTIYTGAFQFVLITFLSSGASVLTIAVTALLMNSRQAFYSLSFVDEFKKMGRKMPYMIHTMTDETYAVNCTLTEQGEERRGIILLCAAITFCLRALPFFMFKGKKQMLEKVCCLAVFSLRTDWDLHRSQKAGIGICFSLSRCRM